METALFVGVLSAIVTVLTLLGVGLYRIISSVLARMQTVEHEIVGNGVSNGLVGKMETMQEDRQRQHEELSEKLDSQRKRQRQIVRAIRDSDHINIKMNQGPDNKNEN